MLARECYLESCVVQCYHGLGAFNNIEFKRGKKSVREVAISWDTDSWSIFCDPHWELICCNKRHPGTSGLTTPPEISVGTNFCARHGTKTTPVFLSADGEASWSLLPNSVSLLSSGDTVQQTTGQIWESQKWISININHSYHQSLST